eukprot:5283943-Pleurochrysis_carterae.AAC.12
MRESTPLSASIVAGSSYLAPARMTPSSEALMMSSASASLVERTDAVPGEAMAKWLISSQSVVGKRSSNSTRGSLSMLSSKPNQ